jgi:hypothetical protein
MANDLLPIESVNALELFSSPSNMQVMLDKITEMAGTLSPDTSTAAGRKEIASTAYAVARTKTTIDDAGKTLVAEWKKRSGEVDACRKMARDYLDDLRDKTRLPLTEWEQAEEAKRQAEIDAEAARVAEIEAARIAEIERREAAIREAEERIAEAERVERARVEAIEAARVQQERDEAIRAKARADAEKAAAEAIEAARMAEARAIARAAAAEEEALAEAARIARAREDAIESARVSQERAVRKAEQRERDRAEAEREAQEKARLRMLAEEAERAADIEHRRIVHHQILADMEAFDVPAACAKLVISLIASGKIKRVSINY